MVSRYANPYLLRENIDWTNLDDGKVLAWNDTLGQFEFIDPTGTPSTSTYQPAIVPLCHSTTVAPGVATTAVVFPLSGADWVGKTVEWYSTVWSVAGSAVTVTLRNLTDGETVDWQTVASTTPGTGYCQLTVGSATGNLKTTSKTYELIVTPTGNDTAILGSAYLRISEPA